MNKSSSNNIRQRNFVEGAKKDKKWILTTPSPNVFLYEYC